MGIVCNLLGWFLIYSLLSIQLQAEPYQKDICFLNTFPFFSNIERIKITFDEKLELVKTACSELQDKKVVNSQNIGGRLFTKYFNGLVLGGGAGTFDSMKSSSKQLVFKKELDKIKSIQDPMERVRKTYELVVSKQGDYDDRNKGLKTWHRGAYFLSHTPSNLIESADAYKTVGVCREMAALLEWSLLQVSRHSDSKKAELGPNDFSAEMTGSFIGGVGNHAWIRVHIPQYDSKGKFVRFNTFDLDNTWYSDFAILFPRDSSLSEHNRKMAINQCERLTYCLEKKIIETRKRENANYKIMSNQTVKKHSFSLQPSGNDSSLGNQGAR